MFRFGMSRFDFLVRSPDGDAGGADGGENLDTGAAGAANVGATEPTDIQKQIDAAVAAAVAVAVNGLKSKNSELIGKEKALKAELAAANGKPTLTDAEYTEFRTLQERLANDELLKLMAEGKSEDAIERITRRTRIDADAKLAAEAELRNRVQGEANDWKTKYEKTLIDNELTKAAAATVKPQYAEVINQMIANKVKLVDGVVRIVNAEGEIEMTANGAKPLAVSDYIETLRGNFGDLFITSSGGGAGGSGKKTAAGPGGSSKLSMDAVENMPMADYVRLRKEGKI